MDWNEEPGGGVPDMDWLQMQQLVVSARRDGPLRLMFLDGIALWEPTPDLAHQSAVHRIVRSARPVTAAGAALEVVSDVLFQTDSRSVVRCDIGVFASQLGHVHEVQLEVPLAVVEVVRPGHERAACEFVAPHCQRAGISDVVVLNPGLGWARVWSGGNLVQLETPLTLELAGGLQISL